ncbi:MAG TPA: glycosyltransferase, partial [Jatrophihabitantaceae bacterium]|nr:glycosyltransferase [Jatrophihabitantaceae bacterium]
MTRPIAGFDHPRVALVSYSTKARGGVVHTLSLAEAMVEDGMRVQVVSLGDPDEGFYRPVRAPYSVVPAPEPADTLENRVFASIDALEAGLAEIADAVDIVHTQDCISARAAARVRDSGADIRVLRTVHHVDDFTTAALID